MTTQHPKYNTRVCERCGETMGSTRIKTFFIETKLRGKEEASLCVDCLMVLIDMAVTLEVIRFDKLKRYANREITAGQVF